MEIKSKPIHYIQKKEAISLIGKDILYAQEKEGLGFYGKLIGFDERSGKFIVQNEQTLKKHNAKWIVKY